jgi:hypothetical protein
MNYPPLQAVKCPKVRPKGNRADTRCNCMMIPGKDFSYCSKCCTFFRVIREAGKPLRLIEIDKKKIRFMWLLLEYETL